MADGPASQDVLEHIAAKIPGAVRRPRRRPDSWEWPDPASRELDKSGAGKTAAGAPDAVTNQPARSVASPRPGRRGRAGRASPRPEPGAGSAGRGAAQRRRLDL